MWFKNKKSVPIHKSLKLSRRTKKVGTEQGKITAKPENGVAEPEHKSVAEHRAEPEKFDH